MSMVYHPDKTIISIRESRVIIFAAATIVAHYLVWPIAVRAAPFTATNLTEHALDTSRQLPTPSAPNLNQLFNLATQRFWHVEPHFNYSDNFIESLPILPQNSAKRPQYRLAAATAEAFLRVQARSGAGNWQTPTMLYLAAAAESSLGNDSEALALIDRLLTRFPNYRHPRMEGFYALDRPTSGEMNRLALFHTLRLIAPSPPQVLQTATATANATGKPSAYLAALLKKQTPLQLKAGSSRR